MNSLKDLRPDDGAQRAHTADGDDARGCLSSAKGVNLKGGPVKHAIVVVVVFVCFGYWFYMCNMSNNCCTPLLTPPLCRPPLHDLKAGAGCASLAHVSAVGEPLPSKALAHRTRAFRSALQGCLLDIRLLITLISVRIIDSTFIYTPLDIYIYIYIYVHKLHKLHKYVFRICPTAAGCRSLGVRLRAEHLNNAVQSRSARCARSSSADPGRSCATTTV